MAGIDVTTKTKGGEKLKRTLHKLSDRGAMMRRIESGMRRELLPEIESGVGRRTGRLAGSFNLRTRGDAIELTSRTHYSRTARFTGRTPNNAPELAHEIAGDKMAGIVRSAVRSGLL